MKKNTIKLITAITLTAGLAAAALIWGVPFVKHKIFENKIRDSLLEAYPGANIISIKCAYEPVTMEEFEESYSYYWYEWLGYEWPEEELYIFEIDAGEEDQDVSPILGLAAKDGTVLFDEYAFFYYREELQAYVTDILDPEVNFPGAGFEYHDLCRYNRNRLVETGSCSTFEGFLSREHVGDGAGAGPSGSPGCIICFDIDTTDEDIELQLCRRLSELLLEADCQVYIVFTNPAQSDIAKYYTFDAEYREGRFLPYDPVVANEMELL